MWKCLSMQIFICIESRENSYLRNFCIIERLKKIFEVLYIYTTVGSTCWMIRFLLKYITFLYICVRSCEMTIFSHIKKIIQLLQRLNSYLPMGCLIYFSSTSWHSSLLHLKVIVSLLHFWFLLFQWFSCYLRKSFTHGVIFIFRIKRQLHSFRNGNKSREMILGCFRSDF
jgi:hypothetical protein